MVNRLEESKLKDLGYIIIGALTAYLIYSFLGFVLNTPMPIVAVMTESMIPTIYPGDAVVIYNYGNISVGDIIVFDGAKAGCRVNFPIIHRVIEINPDGTIQTKGDYNLFQLPCEKSIKKEYIYGKSLIKIPFIGWPKKIVTDAIYTILSKTR